MPGTNLYARDTVTRPLTALQEMTIFVQMFFFFFKYDVLSDHSPLNFFLVIYFTHGIKYLDKNSLSSHIASDQEPIKENGKLVFVFF